ncbi:MAG: pseudouridine synthase [Benjaminiella poitrasii]|nr:MAG: pseudouridine synthase [Benjaminiella poitrasii]
MKSVSVRIRGGTQTVPESIVIDKESFTTHYDRLSRNDLIAKIQSLERQVQQQTRDAVPKQHARPFDMNQYGQHRIALRVAYLGWNYAGFESQKDAAVKTVEDEIFRALERCRLISDRKNCDYSRCGRTDKGVSGLGQVIALNVRRTTTKESDGPVPRYISTLNRCLPTDIRILAWTRVPSTFNARFDCISRTYTYVFQREQLDIGRMQQAARYLVGTHDFRNFCKLDPTKAITNYERTILAFDIDRLEDDLYEVRLKGTAFLWNQVRCIMAVLFLVGQGRESPEIVKRLVEIDRVPARPTYAKASSLPLVLRDCEYRVPLSWVYLDGTRDDVLTPLSTYRVFHEMWTRLRLQAVLARTFRDVVGQGPVSSLDPERRLEDYLQASGTRDENRRYVKLLDRPRADSHEVKMNKYKLKLINKARQQK